MFERAFTVGIANNGGPDAIAQELNLPDGEYGRLYLEAWISNFGSSNVHLMRGSLSLIECQDRLERGFVDCLMTLTGAGPSCITLPDDVSEVTLFFETQNTAGQSQLATLRVTDRKRYE